MASCSHRAKRSWKPVFKKREFVAFCPICGAATGGRKKMPVKIPK